ncbi:hypothetical protein BJ972_001631 [Agromyces atrinae]|uniref:Uncharacterized protein n=1 Tax=Agromyces atrinae TaxID=592376 RepID=A0A852S3W7_9MICO|nr:hypothetical protein [Agromyces atrinae]
MSADRSGGHSGDTPWLRAVARRVARVIRQNGQAGADKAGAGSGLWPAGTG